MKQKIAALVMAVVMVVLEVLEKCDVLASLGAINTVVVPILFIATFVLLISMFKEDATFKSKWTWVAVFILATYFLWDVTNIVFGCVNKRKALVIISNLLSTAGYGAVLLAFLKQSFWKLAPFGFGALIASEVVSAIASGAGISFMVIVTLLMFAALLVLSLKRFKKIEKVLRWVAIVLAALTISTMPYVAISAVITAILLVPIGKFKIDFEKVVAILCIVLTVFSVTTVLQSESVLTIENTGTEISELRGRIERTEKTIEDYKAKIKNGETGYYTGSGWYRKFVSYNTELNTKQLDLNIIEEQLDAVVSRRNAAVMTLIATPVSAAGLICLAIVFWKKKYGKLGFISCGLLGLGTIISLFANGNSQAFWNFDLLNYPLFKILFSVEFFSILLVAVLAAIMQKAEERPVKLRILAIVLAAITVVFAAGKNGAYNLYAITMILAAIALVPFKFNEYNSIGKHIFWNIITLGIWNLIWVYNVTKNLNRVNGVAERKAKTELLLYMFLPFYSVYWYYKTAEYVDAYAAENEKQSKLSMLSLIFGLVCPMVPYVVLQDKINQIVGKPEI